MKRECRDGGAEGKITENTLLSIRFHNCLWWILWVYGYAQVNDSLMKTQDDKIMFKIMFKILNFYCILVEPYSCP